jgi:hypothetical protein
MARRKAGQIIDAGKIVLAPRGGMTVTIQHRGRIETRQIAVAEFDQLIASTENLLPQPMASIVADAARAGIRHHQGRSGAILSHVRRTARETALAEAPALLQKYRTQAYNEGRERSWARRATAEAVRRRMRELGDSNPPSIDSLMKRKIPAL